MSEAAWQEPMLAQLVKPLDHRPVRRSEWQYERKLDGLRCLAVRHGGRVELWSRNHLSFTARFPDIVAALAALGPDDFTLDGEIVAYEGSRSSFAALQRPERSSPPTYCVFDLLHLLGRDTTELPLPDRQGLAARVLEGAAPELSLVQPLEGEPAGLLRQACRQGWEGLVAKRLAAAYVGGRSGDWQKLKCLASQELVVGGWTDPAGTRTGLGALLLGYYDDAGALHYAGKVGTGFDHRELVELHATLTGLAVEASPFAEPLPRVVRGAHFVRPELVAAVAFTEWTADGRLRHPTYQGLRVDKPALEVRRES